MSFAGLSAFPVTPYRDGRLDEGALSGIIARAAQAGVDSLGVLGSTGGYLYLDRGERARILEVAIDAAGSVPVIAGVGALRTDAVLALADDAAERGAAALLLAPVSYQRLTEEEVYALFATLTQHSALPVVVYDNPGTTGFTFSDALYSRLGEMSGIAAIKVPPITADPAARVRQLRTLVPEHVTLGISGDASAAAALGAGIDAWFSVVAGTLPEIAVELTRAARAGDEESVAAIQDRLGGVWDLFAAHGSARVIAAIAEAVGAAEEAFLPAPLQALPEAERQRVRAALSLVR